MKKLLCFMLSVIMVLTFSIQAFAEADSLSAVEKNMINVMEKIKSESFELSKQIWELKELGMEEFKSSALLVEAFKKHGFTVQYGVTAKDPLTGLDMELPTAFIATYEGKEGGPTIGITVEYDALPNGHACGHNLISLSGLVAAIGIKEALQTTPGKVVVFGTPAEETVGGKIPMLAAGLMKDVDVAFSTHGSGGHQWSTELNAKAMTWAKYETGALTFKGKSSHASASPEKGRSALDAAMLMGIGLEFLREHMIETDRIHYIFMDGGKAANVVPDSVTVDIYVRADTTPELEELRKRVDNIIKGAALMTDTIAEYTWDAPFLNAVPVPRLWNFVADTAGLVGVSKDKFLFNTKAGGSTDLGNVGYEMPTANINFPIAEVEPGKEIAGHSDEFRDAAIKEYAMENSFIAGKIIALSAYRLLTNPTELQAIKDEFVKNKQ